MRKRLLAHPYRGHAAAGLGAAAAGLVVWRTPAVAEHGAAVFQGVCSQAPGWFGPLGWLPPMPWLLLVGGAGAAGAAVLLVVAQHAHASRTMARHIGVLQRQHPAELDRAARSAGVVGRVRYVEDPAPYAFVRGYVRPAVCVTSGLVRRLDPEELEAVLWHERCHLERRDPLRLLAARLAVAVAPLPVLADRLRRFRLRRELAADAFALRRVSPSALAAAVVKAEHPIGPEPDGVWGFGLTEARARQVLGQPAAVPPARGRYLASAVLLGGVFLAAFGLTGGTAFLTAADIHCADFLLTP